MPISAIETTYAGHRFRSRLEGRWAVFFDHFGIPWRYEPEGYVIDGRMYLPDFYLPECGTWIEVKGSEAALDKPFLRTASMHLPLISTVTGERGPRLMILGDIPEPLPEGDWGWVSLTDGHEARYGFGVYHKNKRPWWLGNAAHHESRPWLVPTVDQYEWDDAQESYAAARRARFEHGQSGA